MSLGEKNWSRETIEKEHIEYLKELYTKKNGIKNPLDDFLYEQNLTKVSYRRIISALIENIYMQDIENIILREKLNDQSKINKEYEIKLKNIKQIIEE